MMLKFEDMKIDKEFQELLPVLAVDEYEKLEQNILKYGILDPIKVWQEPETKEWIIIDGYNRHSILQKHIDEIDRLYNAWTGFKIMYEEELHNRDEVKKWMLEQQLGRRNLSDVERYEIVQKFKSVFEEQGKRNQSSGGKGLSNLSKVNTRKEMSKATGISEGTYQKIDKVMKSDNEDLKQQLREKKISVDKAYREIKNVDSKKKETITPQQQIEKFDRRVNEIDNEIISLKEERQMLINRRSSVFNALEIKCPLKYRWVTQCFDLETLSPFTWDCEMYLEYGEHTEVLGVYHVFYNEYPEKMDFYKNTNGNPHMKNLEYEKIPEKYRNDFIMMWKQAHDEIVRKQAERERQQEEARNEQAKILEKARMLQNIDDEDRVVLKKFYRVLANTFHPDSPSGDAESMKYVNELKKMWGV